MDDSDVIMPSVCDSIKRRHVGGILCQQFNNVCLQTVVCGITHRSTYTAVE